MTATRETLREEGDREADFRNASNIACARGLLALGVVGGAFMGPTISIAIAGVVVVVAIVGWARAADRYARIAAPRLPSE